MTRNMNIWLEHMVKDSWISEYPTGSMYEAIEETAKKVPNKVALDFEGAKIKYKDLIKGINKTAQSMKKLGVGEGDVVSIISPNFPQALFSFYATNRLGATANMMHPMLSIQEIKESIEKTKTKVIVILDQIYPKIASIKWEGIEKPTIVLIRVVDALPAYAKPVYTMQNRKKKPTIKVNGNIIVYWNEFLANGVGVELPPADNDKDRVAVIMSSGGTTGKPKGVMLTNYNFNSLYVQSMDICGEYYNVNMKWSSLGLVPIFHGFGLGICIHSMLGLGFCIYLVPVFDFNKSIKLIFKKKINCIYAVPALFEALSRSTQIETEDVSFIKMLISGGDKISVELQKRINSYMEKKGSDVRVREAFGQTESVCGGTINPRFDIRIGSVGIAYPDNEIKVVKLGTIEEAPLGEEGELCIFGPTVMKGYFDNEEATAQVLKKHDDGKVWLHTGDVFTMDKDGYAYYKRRINRMIICAGYNIYLNEVEEIIQSCPCVSVCCAVGREDKVVGKRLEVYVELNNPNADIDECKEVIRKKCEENLAQHSIPSKINVVKEIPRTPVGKIDYVLISKEGVKC